MSKEAIIRILNTIQVYISNEFDGVYINTAVLDELCDELKEAIHCNECCSEDCGELDND